MVVPYKNREVLLIAAFDAAVFVTKKISKDLSNKLLKLSYENLARVHFRRAVEESHPLRMTRLAENSRLHLKCAGHDVRSDSPYVEVLHIEGLKAFNAYLSPRYVRNCD